MKAHVAERVERPELLALSAAASALMKAWVKGDQQAFEQLAASDFQLRMPGVGVEAQGLSAGGCHWAGLGWAGLAWIGSGWEGKLS